MLSLPKAIEHMFTIREEILVGFDLYSYLDRNISQNSLRPILTVSHMSNYIQLVGVGKERRTLIGPW